MEEKISEENELKYLGGLTAKILTKDSMEKMGYIVSDKNVSLSDMPLKVHNRICYSGPLQVAIVYNPSRLAGDIYIPRRRLQNGNK